MNIKRLLIHLLGGVTKHEMLIDCNANFYMGKHMAYLDMKAYAESLNGVPADDWCKSVYDEICLGAEDAEKELMR